MSANTAPTLVYVTYQGTPETRFDRTYYVERHLPLVMQAWGRYGLESVAAFFPAEGREGTIAICECRFRDAAAIDRVCAVFKDQREDGGEACDCHGHGHRAHMRLRNEGREERGGGQHGQRSGGHCGGDHHKRHQREHDDVWIPGARQQVRVPPEEEASESRN